MKLKSLLFACGLFYFFLILIYFFSHQQSGSGEDFIQEYGVASIGVRAFYCPQCLSRYCQTPAECRVCGLLLLTAPQLARAHQHLQPLAAFAEVVQNSTEKFFFLIFLHF